MNETPQTPETPDIAPAASSDTPPDRLAIRPASPYFNAELLQRGIGIRFKDVVRTNVEEYCVSEGWVRLAVGKAVDRKGNALTVKLQGPVEPYFQSPEVSEGEA